MFLNRRSAASGPVEPTGPAKKAVSAKTVGAVGAAVAMVLLAALPVGAKTFVPINGAGSTWSQNALDQWARNVNQFGMQVNYAGTGSSDGRNQFARGTVDFAVSEIPYGLVDNGVTDTPPTRNYAYMPIVAGGTSFMYNLKIGGRRVTNLRLSGDTVAKIFTGKVTNWSDPAVRADNPGLRLPARKIVPVVRSDGSGTTAQFTLWMSKREQSVWNDYCQRAGVQASPCGFTSEYPVVPGTGFIALNGSLGVSGYVAQAQSEGTITYVEYSYALNSNFPVAKVLNSGGYYTEPTAPNVAVALTQARINNDSRSADYLTQILDGVYANRDRRTYPLSSYSYLILPTAQENGFNPDKGYTLGAFAYYFLCQGQQQVPNLGYSPLPINLVKAGFIQVRRIPGVDPKTINVQGCHNPTFSSDGKNLLAKTAPYPPACDKQGATQCSTGTGGATAATPVSNGSGSGGGGSGGGGAGSGSGQGGSGSAGAAAGSSGGARTPGRTTSSARNQKIDPTTGLPAGGSGQTGGSGTGDAATVDAQPVSVQSGISPGLQHALMALVGLLLVGVVIGPPLVTRALSRKKSP